MPEKCAFLQVVCPENPDHFDFSKMYRGPPDGKLYREFEGSEPPERCPICGAEVSEKRTETIA